MRVNTRATGFAILSLTLTCSAQEFHLDIPRAWDDKEVARLEVPLAQRDRSPRYMSAEEYYALKVRPIYRTYPVYIAGREPEGYFESLKQKEPEIVFDAAKLRTQEDWVRAGEAVFNVSTRVHAAEAGGLQISTGVAAPVTREGIFPYQRYVVRQKGVVEIGGFSCAACHTRILSSGAVLPGAQLDFAAMQNAAAGIRQSRNRRSLDQDKIFSAAPWLGPTEELTIDEQIRRYGAMQAGVHKRQGTSSAYPAYPVFDWP